MLLPQRRIASGSQPDTRVADLKNPISPPYYLRAGFLWDRLLGQAWTSVHAFHEEARHCQGRSEELSADGMLDRASIRTRWSSLRTRCSMKFDLAALLSLSRPLRTGRGLAVAANSVCPFALLRFLNLLQSDVLPSLLQSDVLPSLLQSDVLPSLLQSDVLPSLLQSDVPTCLLRSDVPFCARGFRG